MGQHYRGQEIKMRMDNALKILMLLTLVVLAGGCVSGRVATSAVSGTIEHADLESLNRAAEISLQAPPHRESSFARALPITLADMRVDIAESHDLEVDLNPFSFDEVEPVPSIVDIVLTQYDDWRGVRYRLGGSDYRGVDCSGLVQAIFKEAFQIDLPRSSKEQIKLGDPVPKDEIQPGDLVYFIDRGRSHVGVAVNKKEFVHATRKKGVIISSLDKYWSPRLLRVRRIL
jgi:cell wall-associated NlpC family hydrolase